MTAKPQNSGTKHKGFTLVELLVALVLGLIVIGGAASVFLSNQESYRINEALSEIQDGSRVVFEMMSRDIRSAGLTGCVNNNRVGNTLNNSSTAWWANWGNALMGYDGGQTDPAVTTGTAAGERVAGTDSITILGSRSSGLSVESHNANSANMKLNESTSDIEAGDVLIVCDPDHATVFQVTNYNNSNVTLVHNTGTGSPGNCSKGLGFPTSCASVNGTSYTFGANSQVAEFTASAWYVGNNAQGGTSLFRTDLVNSSGTPGTQSNEMIRNVTDMQIQYHESGATTFVAASAVGTWTNVDAVSVTLTLVSEDDVDTDGNQLTRSFTSTTTIRNRVN